MDGRKARICAAIILLCAQLAAAGSVAASPVRRGAVCLGEPATIVGTSDDDRIVGTPRADVIVARGGNDVIVGNDGADRICAGTDDDVLRGRYGNDMLKGGRGHDHAFGGPGDDLALGEEGLDVLDGGDGDDRDTLVGGADDDSLSGGDGQFDQDFLFGGRGNDVLHGGLGGRDRLYGGFGDDYLAQGLVSFEFSWTRVLVDLTEEAAGTRQATGEGEDWVVESDGVVGSDFGDVITDHGDSARIFRGRGGADTIVAAGGADSVDGGPGPDDLDGGAGEDFLRFDDSPAGVAVSLRDLTAVAEDGTDVLSGFEDVEGSFFDDRITGDDGPNSLHGSFGRNALFGLGGDDELASASEGDAGEGFDRCTETQVEGCESFSVADPPSLPFVSDPVHRAELGSLGTIRGGIAPGLGAPREEGILVDVRRMTPDGCEWWDAELRRFMPGACSVPLGNEVPLRDDGTWRFRVGIDLVVPGAYQVRANWHDTSYHAFDPCQGAFEPVCVELDVRR